LARAKQAIAITSSADDARLQTLISAASEAIETWCGRRFALATYDQKLSGDESGSLWLDQYPVVSISRIAIARRRALTVINTDTAGNQRATVQVKETGLVLTRVIEGVIVVDDSVTWAARPTIEAVASLVRALGNGWSAESVAAFAKWPSVDLRPIQGASSCLGRRAGIDLYDNELAEFLVDEATGEVRGAFSPGFKNVRVEYTAGYVTIPADIQQACARLVAVWLADSSRTAGLESETTGDYRFTRRVTGAALPPETVALLARYRSRRL
jgi:hypothetical protein